MFRTRALARPEMLGPLHPMRGVSGVRAQLPGDII
jgi:hypothetical protein